MDADEIHLPVLFEESLRLLGPKSGGLFVDATLGLGGHSEGLLESSGDVRVLAIDQDAEALAIAKERLSRFDERVTFCQSNFSRIATANQPTFAYCAPVHAATPQRALRC